MGVTTYAGSSLSISDTIPPTYDEAGFEDATIDYTEVGNAASLGERGKTHNDVSFASLKDGTMRHYKGTADYSEFTFEFAIDTADSGQTMLETALDDMDNNYTFKILHSNGDAEYCTGKMFSTVTSGGDGDTIRMGTATIRPTVEGWINVAAAV